MQLMCHSCNTCTHRIKAFRFVGSRQRERLLSQQTLQLPTKLNKKKTCLKMPYAVGRRRTGERSSVLLMCGTAIREFCARRTPRNTLRLHEPVTYFIYSSKISYPNKGGEKSRVCRDGIPASAQHRRQRLPMSKAAQR